MNHHDYVSTYHAYRVTSYHVLSDLELIELKTSKFYSILFHLIIPAMMLWPLLHAFQFIA